MTVVMGAEEVTVVLEGRAVLERVSLSVQRGEFVVLLGGNGSGKTTLIRTLLGLVPRRSGRSILFGAASESFGEWHKIGYVPQRLSLPSSVPATVEEVVLSGRIAHTGPWRRYRDVDRAAAERAVEAVDLAGLRRERVSRLSGGQQQRVLIARALASEPELLVLDEPVSHVDVRHQAEFARIVAKARDAGATVVLVAHGLGAMAGLASHAVVLERGTVVYDGPPEDAGPHDHDVHHAVDDQRRALRPIGDER